MNQVTYEDYTKIGLKVGRVIAVDDFPEARRPAFKLTIDFGPEVGIKRSSAQVTANYTKEDLLGRQVIGVVNFPPKQIGPFFSEVLTLGFDDENGEIILAGPDKDVPLGNKLY